MRAVAAGVVILALLGAAVSLWGVGHGASRGAGGRPLAGAEAPGFRATLLSGGAADATVVDAADLRGQVVVLKVLGRLVPSCEAALPAMERIWRDYQGRGVAMVGIATGDEVAAAKDAANRYGLTYTVAIDVDGAAIAHDYGITGVPETFVGS